MRIRALLGHVTGLRRALGHLLLLAFAIEVFALLSPLFLGLTVDHAIVSADRGLLLTLALAFGLLLLLQTGVDALRGWMLITLGASLKVQARTNLFSHLTTLPASYFEGRHVADVMSRFDSQETILQALTTDLVVAILDGVMCVVTLAVMFALAPMLATVVVIGAALYGLLRWVSYAPLRQASSEAIIWAARRDSHFLESLRGIKTIKLFNGQRDRRAHWLNLLVETVNRQLTTERLDLLFRTANGLVLGLLGIVVVFLAARMIMANTFSIGLLIAFIAYQGLFVRRISDLIDTAVDLRMLGLHAERLADIALTAPEPPGEPRPDRPPEVAIEVRGVSFRYGAGDPWVLRDLSFRGRVRRVAGDRRAVRLRQVDAAQAPRRAAPADRGDDPRQRRAARAARRRGLARHDRCRHAGRQPVRRLDRRQHRLLRGRRRPGAHHGGGARGGGPRRHQRHADGVRDADRRHGDRAVRRAEATGPARPRALPRARGPAARRGDEPSRRRPREGGERRAQGNGADPHRGRAPAGDDPCVSTCHHSSRW